MNGSNRLTLNEVPTISNFVLSSSVAALIAADVANVERSAKSRYAAGIAVAAGLAQVAKIAKTQYTGKASGASGGGGGSMPSAGAPATGAPQFNPINTDFLTNRPDQVQPSYVLAGDVANASEARSRVRDLARL